MTTRQFLLSIFVLITVLALAGTGGYFAMESRRIEVEKAKAVIEKDIVKQKEKTIRTKERWGFIDKLRGKNDSK